MIYNLYLVLNHKLNKIINKNKYFCTLIFKEIKGNIIKWKMGDLIGSGGFG